MKGGHGHRAGDRALAVYLYYIPCFSPGCGKHRRHLENEKVWFHNKA